MPTHRIIATSLAIWLCGCMGGEPGEEIETDTDWVAGKADALLGPVVVSEVGDQFIELRNLGDEAIDLTEWRISFSRRRVRLAALEDGDAVVPAGGAAVVIGASGAPPTLPPWVTIVRASVDVDEMLAHSKRLIIRSPELVVTDRLDARGAPLTIAAERDGEGSVVPSVYGHTAGERNASALWSGIASMHDDPLSVDSVHLDDRMAEFIDDAHDSLDAALYQLGDPEVIDAFVAAHERGVTVRLVTDTRYFEDEDYVPGYQQLIAAGIAVVDDQRNGRQHNKFIVRDGKDVWTGSFNPAIESSQGGIRFEDSLVLRSKGLAAIHTAEFEEMFGGAFGPAKEDGGGHVAFVDGSKVEVYFAPTDAPLDAILRELDRAESSVYFSHFAFFQKAAGQAMVAAHDRGVDVRGVFDRRSATTLSQYDELHGAGIDVRRPMFDAFVHHKFIIVDYGTTDPVVITGSYNLSNSAETSNDETLLVIHDRAVVEHYYRVWSRLYAECEGPNSPAPESLPSLAITEVYGGAPGMTGLGQPFVEVAARDGMPVSLAGLSLEDRDGNRVLLSGSLAAGERRVVPADFGLEFRDALVLRDARGTPLATYDQPSFAGLGHSLERVDLAASDFDAEWQPSESAGGTPGL